MSKAYVAVLVLCLAALAALNLCVRYRGEASWPRAEQLAAWGPEEALNLPSYDVAGAKLALARALPPAPVAALGNSHFWSLRSAALPGLLNESVGGSTLEAWIGQWQGLLDAGKRPAVVLLLADASCALPIKQDPYNGRDNGNYGRWLARAGLPWMTKARLRLKDAAQRFHLACTSLFGIDYVRRSASVLRRHEPFARLPFSAFLSDPTRNGLARDGWEITARQFQAQTDAAAFERAVQAQLDAKEANLASRDLDPTMMRLLELLLRDIRAQGSEVWMLATPESAPATRYLDAHHGSARVAFDAQLRAWQAQGLIQRLELSHDAALCGCGPLEFYDATHATAPCTDQWLQRFAAGKR
jgi:hypothetical protein